MISDDVIKDSCVASGSFSTVGAALTTNFANNMNGVYTGVGVATYTLGQRLNSAQGGLLVTPVLATFTQATVTHTDDATKVIRTWNDAGVALESAYYVHVMQNAP